MISNPLSEGVSRPADDRRRLNALLSAIVVRTCSIRAHATAAERSVWRAATRVPPNHGRKPGGASAPRR